MNPITQAVINYKNSNSDLDFVPIWNHFEPKLQYMALQKSLQTPVDKETFFEAGVEGFLSALRKFDPSRGEFSTYFYTWVRGMMLEEIAKINRPKHIVNIKTTPLVTENGDGEAMELPLQDSSLNPEEEMIYAELEEVI
jgi:RNA polymerase sigma factor (sigma-70 family)